MCFYLVELDRFCIFISVEQQVNDITDALRSLSSQIESMQRTIDSQYVTICQINWTCQAQLKKIQSLWTDTQEERKGEWRASPASVQIWRASQDFRQQQHAPFKGANEGWNYPAYEVVTQAVGKGTRRAVRCAHVWLPARGFRPTLTIVVLCRVRWGIGIPWEDVPGRFDD